VRSALTQLCRKRWKDVSLDQYLADHAESSEIFSHTGSRPDQEQVRGTLVKNMMAIINNDLTDKQRIAFVAELKGEPQDESPSTSAVIAIQFIN
jgi:hypothetical protein